jgi:hypothetical protein
MYFNVANVIAVLRILDRATMAKKVRRIRLKTKSKEKKRRTHGEFEKCYDCPGNHMGWKRNQLRKRRRLPRCPEHREAYDKRNRPWPICPSCRDETAFGPGPWNGSIEKCIADCDACGFEDKALNHFNALTIKVIASPIDFAATSIGARDVLDIKPGEKVLLS